VGLDIYVRDVRRAQIDYFGDDSDGSFEKMCRAAPKGSLRRGVSPYGDTMFNVVQLLRLVEELEGLPEDQVTPAVQRVLDGARLAIRRSGYLFFVGD